MALNLLINLITIGLSLLVGYFILSLLWSVLFHRNQAMNTGEILELHAQPLSDRVPVRQENYYDRNVDSVNVDSVNDTDFAWLTEDISQGNPISWSGRVNPISPFRPTQNNLCNNLRRALAQPVTCGNRDDSMVVVQGHSVPLAHEMYASRQDSDTIVPFAKKRCSMACCPSTYSCDTGCVCGL